MCARRALLAIGHVAVARAMLFGAKLMRRLVRVVFPTMSLLVCLPARYCASSGRAPTSAMIVAPGFTHVGR